MIDIATKAIQPGSMAPNLLRLIAFDLMPSVCKRSAHCFEH